MYSHMQAMQDVPPNFHLQRITSENRNVAITVSDEVLNTGERFGKRSIFTRKMSIKLSMTHSVALYHGANIIGGYFFNEGNNIFHELGIRYSKLNWMENNISAIKESKRPLIQNLIRVLRRYPGRGIEGVAVFLKQEYRDKGLGRLLINYPYHHLQENFSYIWGGQEKQLENLFDWLKRRELLYDTGDCFYTIGSLR